MTAEQAMAIVALHERGQDERNDQAVLTGYPLRQRMFPDPFQAPDYWRARHVLGTISDAEMAEIEELLAEDDR